VVGLSGLALTPKWVITYPIRRSSPSWWVKRYPPPSYPRRQTRFPAASHGRMTVAEALHELRTDPRPFATGEVLAMASRHGLENAVRRREIIRILPGLYSAALHSDSWLVLARAALQWSPDAVLSGASALFAAGALLDAPSRIEVVVPRHGRRRYPAWIAARRSDLVLPTAPWIEAHRMLVPAYAVALGYGAAPPGFRAELVYGPVRSGRTTPEEIDAAVRSLPRVRSRRALHRRAALAAAGIESFVEEVGARDVLAGPEFAGLVRQHRLHVRGASFRVDAFHAPSLTAFEFDGARFHDARRLEDARRDAVLASVGVVTVRFGYADVMNRPDWCRDVALRTVQARVRDDPLPGGAGSADAHGTARGGPTRQAGAGRLEPWAR